MAEALLGLKCYSRALFQIVLRIWSSLNLNYRILCDLYFSDTYSVIQHDLEFSAVFVSFFHLFKVLNSIPPHISHMF
jgi:hypothetical protein